MRAWCYCGLVRYLFGPQIYICVQNPGARLSGRQLRESQEYLFNEYLAADNRWISGGESCASLSDSTAHIRQTTEVQIRLPLPGEASHQSGAMIYRGKAVFRQVCGDSKT